MFYDYYYLILVVPALLIALWAQYNVSSAYKKYRTVQNSAGMTGAEAARMILDSNGLSFVRIEKVSGSLTDHFDPRTNVVRLSEDVFSGRSEASVGIAAHEVGHAVQYSTGYAPMKLRSAIIPVTNIGSSLAVPLVLLGIVLSFPPLAYIGVAAFGLSTLFQLVTLPVEFNASSRALESLNASGRFGEDDLRGAKAVLRAAALTYLAALAVSLANLLRLLLLSNRSKRN